MGLKPRTKGDFEEQKGQIKNRCMRERERESVGKNNKNKTKKNSEHESHIYDLNMVFFLKKSCKAAEIGKINLQFISGQRRAKETKGISIVTEPKIKTQEKRWRSRCGEGSGCLPGRLARADRPRRRSLRGCDERAKMLTCGCYPVRSRTPSASPQARAEFGKTPR